LAANEWELTFRDQTRWRFRPFSTIFVRGGPPTFLTEIVDPQGNVLPIQRRADGRVTSVGSQARGVTMTYGANGFVSEIRDSAARTTQYAYTADDRLETVTDPDGRVTRYTYVGDEEFPVPAACPAQPSFGRRLKTIQYPGRPDPTVNDYGPGRRVLRQVAYDGLEYRFSYQVTGACVVNVSAPNVPCQGLQCPNVDSWENLQAGWRIYGGVVTATTVTRPDGQRYTNEFNARGMTVARTDEQGQRTTLALDSGNRLTQRTDPLGRQWRYEYDARGNRITSIDPLGRIVRYTYDPQWNLVTSITRFDESNQPQNWQFTYDADRGTLLSATNPLGETTRMSYTARGELETVTSALDQVTRFVYSAAGDLDQVADPLGNVVRFGQDGAGRGVAETLPLGSETRWEYDGSDRLTTTTDALGQPTRLTYDPAGRLQAVINARSSQIESYAYDSGDRLVARTDALGRSTAYDYDAAGRLTSETDRRGNATDYGYDGRGRVISITRPEGVTRIAYDSVGRVIEITEPTGSLTYTYDAADRLTREVQTTGEMRTEVTYGYDALDRRVSRTVSGVLGETTLYAYDRANRLRAITYRGESTTFTYDGVGRLVQKALPNGIRQEYAYDNADRLTSIISRNPDASVVDSIAYGYDANGRRVSRSTAGATLPDMPFTAEYDAADRMTSITFTDSGQTFDLQYDANGNLASKIQRGAPANVTSYSWDSRNRLIAINAPGVIASFAYDPLGRRVARSVNGQLVTYVYDGQQAVGEISAGETVGLLTGLGLDDVIARYSPAGARYYLTDALNSVVALSTAGGAVQNRYAYSPYGQVASSGLDGGNSIRYTAREDDGTGLYYYRARYYDSALKRFVSEDPLGIEAGWNVHAYVDGDPISLADPDGELPIAPILIAAGGAALLDIAIQLVFNDFEVGCIDWWQVGISAGLGGLGGWATAARGVAIAARADRAARGGVQAVRAGQAGEDAVRAVVNIGEKGKFVVNGRTRIADGITDTVVSEVKNVKTLSYTRQLRDYVDFARQTGRRFDLFVRPDGGTTLSGPLAEAIADRLINLRTIGIP
ncbi:MAG: RHS repeat-associated core domain-containing protein, partial [Vicinamibacterales bacterium]